MLDDKKVQILPCVVHNGVEPVSYGKHCAVCKLSSDRLLNEFIGFQIHRGRSFIKNQDFSFTEKCSSQTHQLPLSHT